MGDEGGYSYGTPPGGLRILSDWSFLLKNKKVRCAAAKEVGMGNPAEKNDRVT